MTRRLHAVLLAALALLALAVPAAVEAQGNLVLPGLSGGQLREADLAQGATIIVVFATWSPRGQDVDRRINQVANRWGSSARVVAVDFQEDRATVSEFLSGKNLSVPVYLDADGAFAKKYAVTNLPGLVVFKDGRAAYRGRLPDNPDSVLAEIFQ